MHEANYDGDVTVWENENRRLTATLNEVKASKNESTTVEKVMSKRMLAAGLSLQYRSMYSQVWQ